ncbi:predicted protein [Nematostella vectensis]|uniref:Uncharacterized protein n=1 Tax=Nematostella vectensis TaxID=45351 RepID=A7SYW5_NEMVE|nr:predicted protein [Nematostella vectensis]|eukprot:XP_001623205.1 predicted protein [Nematostella vectensis]
MTPFNGSKKEYARAQTAILRFVLKITAKIFQKSERRAKKWFSRENFADKARSGRPTVLTKVANNLNTKGNYKRGSSTKIFTELQGKGLTGLKDIVRLFKGKKGWKAMRRPKKGHCSVKNKDMLSLNSHGSIRNRRQKNGQMISEDYVDKILEKEVRPLMSRRSHTQDPTKTKLFSVNQNVTFVQDCAPAHTAKVPQKWCQHHLPKFVEWPASCDLNPIENI